MLTCKFKSDVEITIFEQRNSRLKPRLSNRVHCVEEVLVICEQKVVLFVYFNERIPESLLAKSGHEMLTRLKYKQLE